jgi:quinol monooxygenase YgiN
MVEKFASIEAFEEHGASATMAEQHQVFEELLEGPIEVTLLDPMALGDPVKGRVGG